MGHRLPQRDWCFKNTLSPVSAESPLTCIFDLRRKAERDRFCLCLRGDGGTGQLEAGRFEAGRGLHTSLRRGKALHLSDPQASCSTTPPGSALCGSGQSKQFCRCWERPVTQSKRGSLQLSLTWGQTQFSGMSGNPEGQEVRLCKVN